MYKKATAARQNRVANNAYTERAGKARDMIIFAGFTPHMREIVKSANDAAGNDHAMYIRHVQMQIDIRTDERDMKAEGHTAAEIAHYIKRNYGVIWR